MKLSTNQKLFVSPFVLMLLMLAATSGKAVNINRSVTDTTHDVVYSQVDVQPQYPDGFKALSAFIKQNLRYPADDAKNNIHGVAFCMFIIEKDGTVSHVKAMRSPTEAMSKEAIRVLLALPAFKPGYKGGQAVRTYYTMPVIFSLN